MSRVEALAQPESFQDTLLSNGRTILESVFRNVTNSESALYQKRIASEKKEEEIELITQLVQKINSLKSWPENWDGHGSAKPKTSSIEKTIRFLSKVYSQAIRSGYQFTMPSISADEDGDVACEWWYKDKKLSIDISSSSIDYRQISNIDSTPEIFFGTLGRDTNKAIDLLVWLTEST